MLKPSNEGADLYPVTAASPTTLQDDALIELSRSNESSALARRDLTGLIAGTFLVVAVASLLLPAHRGFSPLGTIVAVVCYALAARVRFEFGSVYAVPTEPVFVAMWFLVPPRLIPLLIVASLLLSDLPDLVRRRMPLERLTISVASCWFSVGPALVIFLLAAHGPRWRTVPVYGLALLAQFAFDYVSCLLLARTVVRVSPLEQFRGVLPAFAVDSLLWPLGLIVGFTAYEHPLALLLVLPVLLMFATFAKERQYRIDNALELSSAYRGTAMLLGDVIEADDEYTGSHSRHVVDLVLAVSDRLGLDTAERRRAEFAALLHDVGKVKIPAAIINKPGALDDAEWETMKTHTILGEQMLEQIGGLLGEVGRIVRSCHERWDGTGYPDCLAGEKIPLAARIVCTCDAWSAMRTDRTYRKALTENDAVAELHACSGTHFDPQVVDALLAVI